MELANGQAHQAQDSAFAGVLGLTSTSTTNANKVLKQPLYHSTIIIKLSIYSFKQDLEKFANVHPDLQPVLSVIPVRYLHRKDRGKIYRLNLAPSHYANLC
ncbi:MAG: hypothetical protein VKK04_19870 [Synechococcales bacterium]|nr:hypothetical protein [Synechococcales bacterium]